MSAKAPVIRVEVLGEPPLARRVAALTWLLETRRNQLGGRVLGVSCTSKTPRRASGRARTGSGVRRCAMGTVTRLHCKRGFVIVGKARDVRATIYANWLVLEAALGRPRRPAA